MTELEYRRKMCKDCAFRKNSHEMNNGEETGHFIADMSMGKVFACHETMFNMNDHPKAIGDFDPNRNPKGEKCDPVTDHQLCAGWVILNSEKYPNQAKNIPIENHFFSEN